MDFARPRDLLLFGAIAGVAFYLTSALWSALFIVALPQDRDWCKDAMEFQTGEASTDVRCVEFKNTFEELKSYHNRDMVDRNGYWVYAELIAGAFSGWFMFCRLPARRGMCRSVSQSSGGAVIYGMIVAMVVPLFLSWLLPAPVKWFPNQIIKYADAKVERQLNFLRELADQMDTDGRR